MKPPKAPSWKDFIGGNKCDQSSVACTKGTLSSGAEKVPPHDSTSRHFVSMSRRFSSQNALNASCTESATSQSKSSIKARSSMLLDRLTWKNKLHRTKSQHALETCGRVTDDVISENGEMRSRSDNDLRLKNKNLATSQQSQHNSQETVKSVNLCDEKYGYFMLNLCSHTMYDTRHKCARWLAGVRASFPLDDVMDVKEPLSESCTPIDDNPECDVISTNHRLHTTIIEGSSTSKNKEPNLKSTSHRKTKTRSTESKTKNKTSKNKSTKKESKKSRYGSKQNVGSNTRKQSDVNIETDCVSAELIREVQKSLQEQLELVQYMTKQQKNTERVIRNTSRMCV